MKKFILFFVLLLISVNVADAFEETWQWYPGGDTSSGWSGFQSARYYSGSPPYSDYITTSYNSPTPSIYGATYNRVVSQSVGAGAYYLGCSPCWSISKSSNIYPFSSNYIAFKAVYSNCVGWLASCYANVNLYDTYGVYQTAITIGNGDNRLFEILRDSDTNQFSYKINGVNIGSAGSSSYSIGYVEFVVYAHASYNGMSGSSTLYVDDITTTGYLTGMGLETPYHKVTELTLPTIDASYILRTIPLADYTSSQFDFVWKRNNISGLETILTQRVKNSSDTFPMVGFKSWNRTVNLTNNDANYGLYWLYLLKNDVIVSQDFFYLAVPGDVSSITFADSVIVRGQQEEIIYSIGDPQFASYTYYVKVYSASGSLLYNEAVTTASGSVTWDTSDVSAGIYYALLTKESSGSYLELAYAIGEVSATILQRGYTLNLENGSQKISSVLVNITQATSHTTTSNATGFYEVKNLYKDILTRANASKVGYTHNNFTYTMIAYQVYNMDLYMLSTTPAYNNTTILGQIKTNTLKQAIEGATVLATLNETTSYSTTSSTTGFYKFENMINGTYNISVTKPSYKSNYTISNTTNGSWKRVDITMIPTYTVTINATDASTGSDISSFRFTFAGTEYTTDIGYVTISGIEYGSYSVTVASDGYYSSTQTLAVTEDATKTYVLAKLVAAPTEFTTPHYVRFVFQNLAGMRYSDTTVKVFQDNALLFTGISGTDGAVGFKLNQTVQYRINFYSVAYGFNKNYTLYPVGTEYIFYPVITSTTLFNNFTYSLVMTATSVDFTWNDPENEVSYLNMTITNTSIYPLYEYFSIVKINASTPSNYYSVHLTNKSANIPATMWYLMNKSDVTADREVSTHFYNTGKTKEFPFWIDHLTAVDNFSVWVNITDSGTSTFRWYFGYNYTNNTDYSSVNTTQNYINLSTLSSPLATKMGNTSFVYNVNSTAHSGTLSYTFDQSTIDYTVRINVTTVNFGVMQIVRTFRVPGYGVQMTGVQDWFVMSIALFFILIVGMMFGYNHASIGALITAGMAVFFSTIGWIQLSDVGKGVIAIAVFIAIVGLLRGRK